MNYSLRIFHFISGSLPSLKPLNLWGGSGQTLPAFIPPSSCSSQLSFEGSRLSLTRNQNAISAAAAATSTSEEPVSYKLKGSTVVYVLPVPFPFNDCTSWAYLPVTETTVHNLQHWPLVKLLCDPSHQFNSHSFFCFTWSSGASKQK